MAYDPTAGTALLLGGEGQYGRLSSQTWLWSKGQWHLSRSTPSPSARAFPTMAYVGRTGEIDMFGGFVDRSGHTSGEIWTWSANTWRRQVQHGLPPLAEAAMAYDPLTSELVLEGGTGVGGRTAVGQTWVSNGSSSTWKALGPMGPGDRAGAGAAYDPTLGGVVIFGGWSTGTRMPAGTWLWARSRWRELAGLGAPPARSGPVMGFDGRADELVLFGGASPDLSPLSDQWSLGPGFATG